MLFYANVASVGVRHVIEPRLNQAKTVSLFESQSFVQGLLRTWNI